MRILALVLALAASPRQEKPKPLVLRGAKVYTCAGAPLESGVLVLDGGKIAAVGKDAPAPADAVVLDLSGKVVIPGLVDAASQLLVEPAERGPGSAEHDVLDTVDLYPTGWREAREQGVTTVYVGPPSSGPVNGLGAVLRLDERRTPILRAAALKLTIGAAPGEVSSPTLRYEAYPQLKQAFEGARAYVEAKEKHRKDLADHEAKRKALKEGEKPPPEPQKPKTEPRLEALARAIDPKAPLTVRIEAHTADAIALALRLAADFKLKAVLEQATEGHLAAAEIRKAGVPVVVGPVFRSGLPSVDTMNHSVGTAAALSRAGVPVAVASFGGSRFLAESAALAASKGLTREQALGAITIDAARILGLEKTIGSLEKGKSADLVVLSGEPFDPSTRVEQVFVEGR
jgi:imidazolonepropionase-like amidohydrolase